MAISAALQADPHPSCEECGFDPIRWSDADATNTLRVAAPMVEGFLEGLDPELAVRRPSPSPQRSEEVGRWSIVEYVDHLREVFFGMRLLLDTAREDPGVDLGPAPEPVVTERVAELDLAGTVEAVGVESFALFLRLTKLDPSEWTATVGLDGHVHDVHWIAQHSIHELSHHLRDVADLRRELGDAVPRDRGTVVQLNISGGGVPKRPIGRLDVRWDGIVDDAQNDRQNHGRPFQALCVWSAEVIEALAADGHPVEPGFAGENVTITGLDWARLRPGAIVRIGEVTVELSSYTIPCKTIAGCFSDRDFNRIHPDRYPGGTRFYATVLDPGTITVGDAVVVEPEST